MERGMMRDEGVRGRKRKGVMEGVEKGERG